MKIKAVDFRNLEAEVLFIEAGAEAEAVIKHRFHITVDNLFLP